MQDKKNSTIFKLIKAYYSKDKDRFTQAAWEMVKLLEEENNTGLALEIIAQIDPKTAWELDFEIVKN